MDQITTTDPGEVSSSMLATAMRSDGPAQTDLQTQIEAHRFARPSGALLKLEGDESHCVYVLLSGWLAISKSSLEGQRQIIDVVLPSEILDPSLADRTSSAVQIEALGDLTYAAIPHEDWSRLRHGHAEVMDAVDRMSRATLSRISERMLRLGKCSAATMIAFALCELCVRSAPLGLVEGETYHIPMTQQQLGDFCGLSSVHVCRTLRRLKRNGILETADHMDIVIRDVDALADIAEIDPVTLRQDLVPAA